MKKYYEEAIGLEPMLPVEVIDLLHIHKPAAINKYIDESITTKGLLLDEHELAMAA